MRSEPSPEPATALTCTRKPCVALARRASLGPPRPRRVEEGRDAATVASALGPPKASQAPPTGRRHLRKATRARALRHASPLPEVVMRKAPSHPPPRPSSGSGARPMGLLRAWTRRNAVPAMLERNHA